MELSQIKNQTKESLSLETLRQFPIALRMFYQREKNKFDNYYNVAPNTFLARFTTVRYPVTDRTYGSPYESICNIFWNLTKEKGLDDLINEFLEDKKWIYHPVRSFERYNNISKLYYGTEEFYWAILLFNRILDPFTSMKYFNMIRVPYPEFIARLEYRYSFDFTHGQPLESI